MRPTHDVNLLLIGGNTSMTFTGEGIIWEVFCDVIHPAPRAARSWTRDHIAGQEEIELDYMPNGKMFLLLYGKLKYETLENKYPAGWRVVWREIGSREPFSMNEALSERIKA